MGKGDGSDGMKCGEHGGICRNRDGGALPQ
ncbi:hypothetical protein DP62_5929 [Burkholderia pseudomallei]|nr:hypothetical protein DP62_5929 [Burkholderia pseudomallei]